MPDNFRNPPLDAIPCPENYPNPPHPATSSLALREKILSHIAHHGPLPFPEYLQLALYHPELGYYAKGDSQVGRSGDFYTSVSVGPLFGRLLAQRFSKWWSENGSPKAWRILEIGAHDGKLAADILTSLQLESPDAWENLQYTIPEPLPLLRNAQHTRLKNLVPHLHLTPTLHSISASPLPGIAFGNEILDALPFHLVEMHAGTWQELHVSAAFTLIPKPIPPTTPLASALEKIGTDFPQGYRTELRTNFPHLLKEISACLTEGTLLFIDYGFASPEYYHPTRTTGTLRTFSKHQAAEDPLLNPGNIDITAHVDFTHLATAAQNLGLSPTTFSNQGTYLTHLATPLLLASSLSHPKAIAQFKTLTHPSNLGGSFHAIELSPNSQTPPTVAHRLALNQ